MIRCFLVASALIAFAYAAPLDEASATGSSSSDIQPDGHYSYSWETSNGISAEEYGLAGVAVRGSYSYSSPDGRFIRIYYVADKDGFHTTSIPPTLRPPATIAPTKEPPKPQLNQGTLKSAAG